MKNNKETIQIELNCIDINFLNQISSKFQLDPSFIIQKLVKNDLKWLNSQINNKNYDTIEDYFKKLSIL